MCTPVRAYLDVDADVCVYIDLDEYVDIHICAGVYVCDTQKTLSCLTNIKNFICLHNFSFFIRLDEAFTPFKSSPKLFSTAGGTNTALANHVIAKDDDIDDSYQCLLVCLMNKCRSFNYAQSEKTCEVNDFTKSDSPLDLITKSGFQYYHPVEG